MIENNDIQEIVYSIEQPIISQKIQDITNKDYDSFKKQFISAYGEKDSTISKKTDTPLYEIITQMDEEELLFLDSIKGNTPKEKLILIEKYVRNHSFYDMDNKEVIDLKEDKSIDERTYVCQKRIDELKAKKPELASQLENKKRAGVCADFATITVSMLRQAGFLSGVIS